MTDKQKDNVVKRGTGIKGANHILEVTAKMKTLGVSSFRITTDTVEVKFVEEQSGAAVVTKNSVKQLMIQEEKNADKEAQELLFYSADGV